MSIYPFRHCYYKDVLNHDLSADNEENRNNNNQKKKKNLQSLWLKGGSMNDR